MNLNQVTIPSVDLARSVAFYQTLGLKLIVDSIPRYARLECPDGESTFSIHHVDELPSGAGIVLYFENDQLDAHVEALQEKGIKIDSLPVDQPWLWRGGAFERPGWESVDLVSCRGKSEESAVAGELRLE